LERQVLLKSNFYLISFQLPARQSTEIPTCILREQNALQGLEAEAKNLRDHLDSLTKGKENNSSGADGKSTGPRAKPPADPEESALAAMDRAIDGLDADGDKVSMNTESDDLSGRERDLYFAAHHPEIQHRYDTDTDG